MEYDLELDRVVNEIKKQKAKRVLVQLPDGLKPKAKEIVDVLRIVLLTSGMPPFTKAMRILYKLTD